METLNQRLSDELLQLAEDDQAMRMKVINGEADWDSSIDERSQKRLAEVVE